MIERFDKTDVCESSDEQMKATYAKYDEIDKRRKYYMKGVIENRFSCDLLHVSLERPYDLVIARWCLGYLEDKDVVTFLTRCN